LFLRKRNAEQLLLLEFAFKPPLLTNNTWFTRRVQRKQRNKQKMELYGRRVIWRNVVPYSPKCTLCAWTANHIVMKQTARSVASLNCNMV